MALNSFHVARHGLVIVIGGLHHAAALSMRRWRGAMPVAFQA